jgi:hypothetical protein
VFVFRCLPWSVKDLPDKIDRSLAIGVYYEVFMVEIVVTFEGFE